MQGEEGVSKNRSGGRISTTPRFFPFTLFRVRMTVRAGGWEDTAVIARSISDEAIQGRHSRPTYHSVGLYGERQHTCHSESPRVKRRAMESPPPRLLPLHFVKGRNDNNGPGFRCVHIEILRCAQNDS